MTADELVRSLTGGSTAALSDAMQGIGVLSPEVRPVWAEARLVGPAFTVRCYAQSIITVHKALLEAAPGDVLVVDSGGDASGALFGAMMAREALRAGVSGLVTDGAVRDSEELKELAFPVFARAVTPRVGTNRRIGDTNVSISCGGVPITPGDFICADKDGVVVIPKSRIDGIAHDLHAIQEKEESWKKSMANGARLIDLLGFRHLVQDGPH